jgi:phosphonate transport system substrate-binding protein
MSRAWMIAVCLALAFSSSCRSREDGGNRADAPLIRQEVLIGLIPEQNVFRQRDRYMVLRGYLQDRTGLSVQLTSLSRYGNILERFAQEKIDAAFFGSFTFGLAHRQLGVEPLARPVNVDGTSTYHGYIFVRKDSGIRSARDMRGKRFAFVERATTAGYLFPLAWLRNNGVADARAFLGEGYFTGSHDASVMAVLNREADIGAAKNTIYDQMVAENPRIGRELVILAKSGLVPQNCLAVRRDLGDAAKQAIKKALLDMDKDEAGREALRRFGAQRFIETSDADYDYLYRLAADGGIDLKTYQYRNE